MRADKLFQVGSCKNIARKAVIYSGHAEFIGWDNTISAEEKERRVKWLEGMYREEAERVRDGCYKGDDVTGSVLLAFREEGEYESRYDMARIESCDFGKIMEMDPEKPREFINPMTSILFSDREKVYNSEVSEISCRKYPIDEIAASILVEMCYFGLDNESYEKNRDAEVEKLAKAAEGAGREEGIPAEEVFEILGFKDERTEKEKEADRKRIIEKAEAGIREKIKLMQKTAKYYQKKS